METNKIIVFAVVVGAVALIFGGSFFLGRTPDTGEMNSPIISQTGLHWHPRLSLYVGDNPIEIPNGIGLGVVHAPVHTHEDLPIIHLEFSGVVREKDVMLGEFFKNWGKDIRSFGENMRMMVNGEENTEYENYVMHDGDIIEIRYE